MDIKQRFGLSDLELNRLEKYAGMLVEWNQKFNLTAITEPSDIYIKHFADSLLGAQFIKQNATVLDIGAGAGFPSVPIKIMRPDIVPTLCDSVNKKIIFLNELIQELGLTDIKTLHIRAEDIDKKQKFDVAVSRAVAKLNVLCEYALPFVKIGGVFIAYKSDEIGDELEQAAKAIDILGGKTLQNQRLQLEGDIYRRLIIIEKVRQSPPAYPRKKNLPRINPIV